ncbi:hypothetical protein RRG08_019201 [Elysia crispata]|uniref:Uncharacterized protein n=1 Tax=Elysia crispata TaxID=231223 RepID=A0AAE1ATA5_9GAST|nr:hypothetical protein RRG08_019201 [Elysia crispata]
MKHNDVTGQSGNPRPYASDILPQQYKLRDNSVFNQIHNVSQNRFGNQLSERASHSELTQHAREKETTTTSDGMDFSSQEKGQRYLTWEKESIG